MQKKTFYQLSLLLPIITPIIFSGVASIGPLLFFTLGIAGIPYILFSLIILVLSLKRDSKFLERLSWYVPLAFGVFVGLCVLIFQLVTGDINSLSFSFKSIIGGMLVFTAYSCAFGYFYVFLVRLLAYGIYGPSKASNSLQPTAESGG